MKKLLLALALLAAPGLAWGQCSGVFGANQVCGSLAGGIPGPVPATSLPAGPLTVGSTVISGGTNLRVLYDASGVLGEYTNTQLTALMNLATTSLSGALPAWPNNTTTFFRGDGTYATLNCSALTNGSPSCSTDTTNATNITSGTLAAARLPAFGSGDVSFASGGGAGTIGTNAVTNAKAAQVPANSMKGNWTGSTANAADNTVPSCPDSAGNHLNYVSGTGITCGTSSAGTAYVLLNTLTASSSATLSYITSFTSAYSSYDIVFINLIPATNAVACEIEIHSGGSFQVTNYVVGNFHFDSAGSGANSSTTFIPCSNGSNVVNSSPGINGIIHIYNPSQTVAPKILTGFVGGNITVTNPGSMLINAYWNGGNGAVDGFAFLFSSGNITSGTIKIYGRT